MRASVREVRFGADEIGTKSDEAESPRKLVFPVVLIRKSATTEDHVPAIDIRSFESLKVTEKHPLIWAAPFTTSAGESVLSFDGGIIFRVTNL